MTDADEAAIERVRQQAGELFLANHIEKHALEQTAIDREHVAHEKQHAAEALAVKAAVESERQRLIEHQVTHAAAHASHEALHASDDKGHIAQHVAENRAVSAATAAMDKRLDQMNEFRDQLRDQASTFVRGDAFEVFKDERRHALSALDASIDSRLEALTKLVQTEREERRATEGVKRGMNATTAIIVTAIGVVGTVLGIIIVGANLLTGTP